MRKIITVYTLFLIANIMCLFANGAEFKVLASKGDILIQKNGTNTWNKIKAGTELFDKDKIKLNNSAYLGLSYIKGGTLEIQNEGTFVVSELCTKMASKRGSLTKQFSDYVASEVVDIDDLTKKETKIGATGAVERGLGDYTPAKPSIKTDFPSSTSLIDPQLNITWGSIQNENNYVVTISDKKGKEINKQVVNNSKVSYNLEELKLQPNQTYTITIKASTNSDIPSKVSSFNILSRDKVFKINKQLKNLKNELGQDENTALGNVIIGKFYEEFKLNVDALVSYKKAIELVPEVPEYKAIYDTFSKKVEILD